MILYSKPTVEKFFNKHHDTFKEIVSACHDFDDSEILKACAHAVGACVRIVNLNI